ncbi:MAG: LPS export ABC transporter permease LptF, partial [Rudaea sp.]
AKHTSPIVYRIMPLPTLRIIDRYLARELLLSFVAATAILLLVTVGGNVADLLNKIAHGKIPAELLFALIGLHTVEALTVLAPLAVFVGVQLAYGRLYRESEMAVFAASGLPVTGLLRPLMLLAVPLMIVMALISFWWAPASERLSQSLVLEANRSLIIAGLEPGRFVELPNNDGVMYVEAMNEDGTRFKKMFVASEHAELADKTAPAKSGHAKAAVSATAAGNPVRINVITAADGELYHDVNGSERYLGLNNGFRVEGTIGEDNYRLLRYERNDIKLTDSDADSGSDSAKIAAPTLDLLRSNDPVQRAELHWRLAAPLSMLVLVLLALPLSKSSPRQPRYAGLLIALLSWSIYFSALSFGRNWIKVGKLGNLAGLWWVYIPTLLIAAYLLWSGQQLPKPKRAAPPASAGSR